jgi:hypothetical protein
MGPTWRQRNERPDAFPHTCDECIVQRRFKGEKHLAQHERDKHSMV